MREIALGTGQATKYIRMLLGGKVASGKTSFAATAPRPLIFGSAIEGGFKTLEPKPCDLYPDSRGKFDPALLWEPDVLPVVWAMECMSDYFKELNRLQELIRIGKCPWSTLVFDSLSVYTHDTISELGEKNVGQDGRQRYGSLGDAVSLLVKRIHTLPMHVIWLCHTDDNDELLVAGQASKTSFAKMDIKLLIRADIQGKGVNHQIHTRPFRNAEWIGVRSFNLPNPMIPSFKALAHFAGLNEYPTSPALPTFNGVEMPFGAVDPETGQQYPLVAG